ncbi:MAG TPA: hypothetical protein VF897_13770, partial [Roseiflexaceae bacterium]
MRRANLIVLIALLLAGCAAPATEVPTPALTDQQPTAAAGPPTAAPMPTSLPTPTVAVPTAPPTVPPAATQPTAAPAAPAPTAAPLNPQDQAAALLPGFAGDLGRAGEWNRYTISAAIDPAARTIAGGLRLEYTNRDSVALDRLYFHLYPNLPDFGGRLAAANLAVDGTPVELVYEAGRFLLRVNLPHPLAPGASATVTMDFSTAAPENASRNRYGAFNKESGVLSLASSYPTVAIVRRGDWDLGRPDPQGDFVNSETALYDVTLTAPPDWPLATTGVAVASQPGDGGRQTQRFVSGPQRDFMIVATQLARESAMVDGTRINSYYRPEQASRGQAALQAAAGALRAFNKRFGAY